MGYQTSLNLKVIISIVSFKQNMNLEIQILVGNTLMSRFHVSFEIELPLVNTTPALLFLGYVGPLCCDEKSNLTHTLYILCDILSSAF